MGSDYYVAMNATTAAPAPWKLRSAHAQVRQQRRAAGGHGLFSDRDASGGIHPRSLRTAARLDHVQRAPGELADLEGSGGDSAGFGPRAGWRCVNQGDRIVRPHFGHSGFFERVELPVTVTSRSATASRQQCTTESRSTGGRAGSTATATRVDSKSYIAHNGNRQPPRGSSGEHYSSAHGPGQQVIGNVSFEKHRRLIESLGKAAGYPGFGSTGALSRTNTSDSAHGGSCIRVTNSPEPT